MDKESSKTIFNTLITLIINHLWKIAISAIAPFATFLYLKGSKLVKDPVYVQYSLIALSILFGFFIFFFINWLILYKRYGRFLEKFGILWDSHFNMRCMSCKKPLKHSSTSPSIMFCCDPKCNSQYILKDGYGNMLTQNNAIEMIKSNKVHSATISSARKVPEFTANYDEPDKNNNKDLFPMLNESALKKHIKLKVQECRFNEIIKRIVLYQGVVNHYQLIVEALAEDSKHTNIQFFWQQETHILFGEHFSEVYRTTPSNIYPYQKGSFWNDWNCIVVEEGYKLPETLVENTSKWVLYAA